MVCRTKLGRFVDVERCCICYFLNDYVYLATYVILPPVAALHLTQVVVLEQ
jgi:hypothetical protein